VRSQKLYHPVLSGSTRFFIFLVVDQGIQFLEKRGDSSRLLPRVLLPGKAGTIPHFPAGK